jgi:hypothetical protein
LDNKSFKNPFFRFFAKPSEGLKLLLFREINAVVLNLFKLAAHLMAIFFAAHLNPQNNLCGTPTLYIMGKKRKTHFSSLFYYLAAHLEVNPSHYHAQWLRTTELMG